MSQERDKFEAWATPRFPGLDLSWDTEAREYFTAEAHMVYHGWLASRRAALEEAKACADSWTRADAIKLAAGEMSAQELRTAQAVARGIASAIGHLGEGA